ncbi:hypothetical protein [Spirillospora sp. CA-128828]|uniref:hypothetical protein n=1 Tax=Spirillospora sp. CA-128828 TaxID=3240033 RepID=UPI003D946E48
MTERVITEVTAHLSAKIDKDFADVHTLLGKQDRRLDELTSTVRVAAATVTDMVAGLADVATGPPTPGASLPRPEALDDACKAASAGHPQKVEVDVYGRAVTQYVQPGDDPAQIWDDMCATITRHAGVVAWHN